MKLNKTIFIPNISTPTNIGDLAMIESLLTLLPTQRIHLSLAAGDKRDHTLPVKHIYSNAYDFMVWEDPSVLGRAGRILLLIATIIFPFIKYIIPMVQEVTKPYDEADIIVFVGNGYLRSRGGVSQVFNFLFVLSFYILAIQTKKPIILCPFSFGPFAYSWQEKLAARFINRCTVVSCRDEQSLLTLKQHGVQHSFLAADHALLLPYIFTPKLKKSTVGFSIRPWYKREKQQNIEEAYAIALVTLQKQKNVDILPIVQVTAPHAPGEDDTLSVYRVVEMIRRLGGRVTDPVTITSIAHASRIYGQLDFLIGMRMHANILAAVSHTPFVAISYEHKTEGIARMMGFSDYVLPVTKVTIEKLTEMVNKAYKNKSELTQRITKELTNIHKTEEKRWQQLFNIYI